MFVAAKKIKQKRAIAEQIFNEIQALQPPGRFLEEDPTMEARHLDNVPSTNAVHHTILNKSWLIVEPEKALLKILKRLREKEKGTVHVLPQSTVEGSTAAALHSQVLSSNLSPPEQNNNDACLVVEVAAAHDPDSDYPLAGKYLDEAQEVHDANDRSSVDYFPSQSHITLQDKQQTAGREEDQLGIGGAELCKYLEGSGLNFETDTLLQTTTPQPETDTSEQLHEYTMRQWIMSCKPSLSLTTATTAQSSEYVAKFIKPALLIALKLTECILEAEKDEKSGHGNPIPLASIAPENVLIRVRKYQNALGESNEDKEDEIDFVWVMSIVGDGTATGTVMSRLFAVGKVLFALFSNNSSMLDDDSPPFQVMASIDSISLGDDTENDNRTCKKSYRPKGQAHDSKNSEYIADLETNGVPWSVCALVMNLLECRHNPFCDDNAYTSFDDLLVDLQLMIDNPSCFLDSIHISNVPKLKITDKLYGRDQELLILEDLYQSHITSRQTTGVVISGGAGAGKSTLAMYLQKVARQSNGHFLLAKFEHNQMSLKPLSTIANMLDSLCGMLHNDSSHYQLTEIEKDLTSALGSQPNLLWVVPNLKKLMPKCENIEPSTNNCVDNAVSMRYLCRELLRVISSYTKPITLVIDDIQFADHASLILIGSLLLISQRAPVFFCLCHRDDEVSMSPSFEAWLTTISEFSLATMKLEHITPKAVNNLISEAMHLSPRLSHPLSSVLHHKTRGNPLFLRQLLDSLTEQGYIFIDMKKRRWAWDLDKIMELEISDDVLALLMSDIQRLSSDLQYGLQIAACIGSCVTESMLNYLLIGLELDLKDTLRQASEKGFMIDIGSTMFRFSHDKIRQAAYELMSERERRENHMRLGLALCSQTLENLADDEKLFFAAVNQINLGGPIAVHDPSQTHVIAELNLKAGKRSIELSDYNTALKLFQHGISFLGDNHWMDNYQLSLDLYDAAADTALIINNPSAVAHYTDLVVLHARCFDDKLHCKNIEMGPDIDFCVIQLDFTCEIFYYNVCQV